MPPREKTIQASLRASSAEFDTGAPAPAQPRGDHRADAILPLVDTTVRNRQDPSPLPHWPAAPLQHRAWSERQTIFTTGNSAPFARRFLLWALEGAASRRSVEQAAAALHINPRRLRRECRRRLGYPPGVILGLARVMWVARTLTKRKGSLSQVAKVHGYSDVPALCHHFQRYVGITPGAYRSAAAVEDPVLDGATTAD